jgi:hypothetical protein
MYLSECHVIVYNTSVDKKNAKLQSSCLGKWFSNKRLNPYEVHKYAKQNVLRVIYDAYMSSDGSLSTVWLEETRH